MASEVGLKRRGDQAAENFEIERGRWTFFADRWLQRVCRAFNKITQRARDGFFAALRAVIGLAVEVGGHRTMCDVAKPGLVKSRQKKAAVAVAHIGFATRRRLQSRQRSLRDAVGAIAAAREPQRIEALVI